MKYGITTHRDTVVCIYIPAASSLAASWIRAPDSSFSICVEGMYVRTHVHACLYVCVSPSSADMHTHGHSYFGLRRHRITHRANRSQRLPDTHTHTTPEHLHPHYNPRHTHIHTRCHSCCGNNNAEHTP